MTIKQITVRNQHMWGVYCYFILCLQWEWTWEKWTLFWTQNDVCEHSYLSEYCCWGSPSPPQVVSCCLINCFCWQSEEFSTSQLGKPINPDLCFQNLNVSSCENLNSCQVKMFHLQISTPRSRLVLNHLLFLSNSSPFFSTHKALLWMSCLIWRLHYASILFTILFVWLNIWWIDAAWLNYE